MAGAAGNPQETQGETRQSPIVLDLGKKKRKSVKQLRNGKGKLLAEALDSIEELQRVGTIPKSAQPVIVIVREKPKSNMFSMLKS